MPKFWRTCSAVWLAALLVVLAGGVAVDAQRPVEGQLFWMSGPTAVPGSLWFAPEKRAWSGDWRLGTSYPHRIWANQVTAAPENDACFPTDLGYTDLHVGPYGLQVGQWFADWWDPQVWREHPNPPADWRFALYGGFWFLPNPFRQAVVNGMPERGPGPGTRSFCAAYELAVQRGDGRSGTWEPAMEEARGPCYAVSRIFRLRINTELRCEPDLRLANDFTVRWWEFYNAFIPQPFFDGTQGLKRFPESYAAPVHWFRRVEATYSQWGPLGGATPVYSVFRRPSGGGLYTRAGGLGGALADRAPLSRPPRVALPDAGPDQRERPQPARRDQRRRLARRRRPQSGRRRLGQRRLHAEPRSHRRQLRPDDGRLPGVCVAPDFQLHDAGRPDARRGHGLGRPLAGPPARLAARRGLHPRGPSGTRSRRRRTSGWTGPTGSAAATATSFRPSTSSAPPSSRTTRTTEPPMASTSATWRCGTRRAALTLRRRSTRSTGTPSTSSRRRRAGSPSAATASRSLSSSRARSPAGT